MTFDPSPRTTGPVAGPGAGRVAVLLLLAGLIGFLIARAAFRPMPATEPRPITPRGDLAAEEKSTIALFKQANPSVVFITTLTEQLNDYFTPTEVPQGSGSGFVWDDAGDVVTNFHVIRGG